MMKRNGFVSLVELLLVVAILGVVVYFAMQQYVKKPVTMPDAKTQAELSEQGINMSQPLSTIEKAKNTVDEANRKIKEMENTAIPPEE